MEDEEAIAAAVEAGTDGIVVPSALIDDPDKNASVDMNLTQRLLDMTVSLKI